jgi:DNA-binding winged helix-turn-helix (wHTH) protein
MAPVVHIRFGAFDLNLETGELCRRGRKLKLSPKPFRVLALLAASPSRLVTREAIQKELWGSDTFVDFEHALNFCIREIRSALGDSAKKPRFIETLPRRGYRFIAAVSNSG